MDGALPAVPDDVELADDEVVPIQELVELYESVNWLLQAADPDALARAVDRSTHVVTARDPEGELIGLARCLTDDVSVLYLREVVVRPDHRRRGIGRALATACLDRFAHVAQKVVLVDDEPDQMAFARSLGLVDLREVGPPGLQAFVRVEARVEEA